MHYTTRVQIAQEQQIADMMIETNRQQIEAQIKNVEPSATVVGMAAFLRGLALSAPRRQRANTNTFPGSNPNPKQTTQRFEDREIPEAGAGQLLTARSETAYAAQDRFDREPSAHCEGAAWRAA